MEMSECKMNVRKSSERRSLKNFPLCLTGDDVDAVTWENLGEEVKLYLFDREGTE